MFNMPCRNIEALQPIAQEACRLFLSECEKKGLKVGICQTLRTAEYQATLYAQGRTTKGNIVTNCDGYKKKSNHQGGMAFDFYQNIKGEEWSKSFYDKACKIGKELGLDMGHYWTNFSDSPHCDVPKNWKAPIIQTQKLETTTTTINLFGDIVNVQTINKDNSNYVKLRDIQCDNIKVGYLNGNVTVNGIRIKLDDTNSINIDGNNYVKLRSVLEGLGFVVGYDSVNKVITVR